jgi:RNA polymerase sigma-70 factor (ECF subfamily)
MPILGPAEDEPRRIAWALRKRDIVLISDLFDRYQYRLVRYMFHLAVPQVRVEDLVQETWLRVLDRAAQYDGRSRFEPWLFSIARNLAIDAGRKREFVSLDTGERVRDEAESSYRIPSSEGQSPFHAAARGEDADRLADGIDRLDPIYREALLLRFQEDLSLQEISTIVGAPVSTVSSRIRRGLALLRSHWEGGFNVD